MTHKNKLQSERIDELFQIIQTRFEKNMHRHKGLKWPEIQTRLEENSAKLWSLNEMEETGGEPDVVSHDQKTGEYIFYDCSPDSPKGRRSLCYDQEALSARKENKPQNSAINVAWEMGIEILNETQYRALQETGDFDTKTSSWILTPSAIRKVGGALFCDFRYGHVFLYHNGAESYYAARGFRGWIGV